MLNRFVIFLFLLLTGCGQGFKRACPNTFGRWLTLPVNITPINLNFIQLDTLNKSIDIWNTNLNREVFKIVPNSHNIIQMGGFDFQGYTQGITFPARIDGIIIDVDIYIKPTFNVDLKSLFVHELGHAIGLEHINDTIMNPFLPSFPIHITIDKEVMDAAQCLYE